MLSHKYLHTFLTFKDPTDEELSWAIWFHNIKWSYILDFGVRVIKKFDLGFGPKSQRACHFGGLHGFYPPRVHQYSKLEKRCCLLTEAE